MKKNIKVILIIVGVVISIILLDTLQARIFKHSPIISWKENLEDEDSWVDKGILIDTYYCTKEKDIITVRWKFKNSKFTCPVDNSTADELTNAQIEYLDKVYNSKTLKDYIDIRNIKENYTTDEAIKDNCFVISSKKYNEHLYTEFMEKYNNKENAIIRVVKTTVEGDLIINDILYQDNKLTLIKDNTRDEFTAPENRKIELKEYKHIGTYEYKKQLYWILYNIDQVTAITFTSSEVFVIATIN